MSSIKELEDKILSLTQENNLLKNNINFYKSSINITSKYSHKNNLLIQRLAASISFLKFINDKSCITGPFVRKFFEFTLNNNELCFDNLTGNVMTTPVRILLTYDFPQNRHKIVSKFYSVLNKLHSLIKLYNIDNSNRRPFFSNYEYIGINDMNDLIDHNNFIIPCKQLVLKNDVDEFVIEFIAWKPSIIYNSSLDLISMSSTRFFLLKTSDSFNQTPIINIYSIFEQIINKQAYFSCSLECFQDISFPKFSDSIPRFEKVKHLLKMYNIIKEYYLPLLESNYRFTGTVPRLFIEKLEDCPITGCSAPYPYFELECGHKISLMGYKGIICKGENEFSESINCPLCRKDLVIQFEKKEMSVFDYDKRLTEENIIHVNKFTTLLVSEDAQKYI
jgi:hypothetical protein